MAAAVLGSVTGTTGVVSASILDGEKVCNKGQNGSATICYLD